jgi:hypothetical protein
MFRAIPAAGLLLLACCACAAAGPVYVRDVTKWQEVALPPASDRGARTVWLYAANSSPYEWRVFFRDGRPQARLRSEAPDRRPGRPSFVPKAGKFRGASAFIPVDDGWLVGFNEGEFGAALYWFSRDGKANYKISDHQVVDFFSLSDGVYAIEGLAHLGLSTGSVIRIARPDPGARWQAALAVKLTAAPCAVAVRKDGTVLIVLSDSLVSLGADRKVRTLLRVPWDGLFPRSVALTRDEQKLYIGMRQFVGELDLTTKKLRFLIPAAEFLNKLPKDDEDRIHRE